MTFFVVSRCYTSNFSIFMTIFFFSETVVQYKSVNLKLYFFFLYFDLTKIIIECLIVLRLVVFVEIINLPHMEIF